MQARNRPFLCPVYVTDSIAAQPHVYKQGTFPFHEHSFVLTLARFSTKMFKLVLLFAIFIAACVGAPRPSTSPPPRTPATPIPFTVIAARSGSPIHLQQIEANGFKFWIGKGHRDGLPRQRRTMFPGKLPSLTFPPFPFLCPQFPSLRGKV